MLGNLTMIKKSEKIIKRKSNGKITPMVFRLTQLIKEEANKGNGNISSMMQGRCLYFIDQDGEPTMKKLAEYFCITPPSATSVIEGMIKLGFVIRKSSQKDRRTVQLAITPKGKKELEKSMNLAEKALNKLIVHLSKSEKESFSNILEKITR